MEVINTDDCPHGLAVKRRAPGPTSWGRKWSQDKVRGELTARLMLVGETLQRGKDGWDKREKRDPGAMSEIPDGCGVAQAAGGAGFSQVWKAHPNRTEAEPRAHTQARGGAEVMWR